MSMEKNKEAVGSKGLPMELTITSKQEVEEESAPFSIQTPRLLKSSSSSITTPSSYSTYEVKSHEPSSPDSDGVSDESAEAEVLMYKGRELTQFDTSDGSELKCFVDESCGSMKIPFLEKVFTSSAYFVVHRSWEGAGVDPQAGNFCQAALVEDHEGVKRFVTAKHCLGTRKLDDFVFKIDSVTFFSPRRSRGFMLRGSGFENANHERGSSPIDLRQSKKWPHGIDLVWGPSLTSEVSRKVDLLCGSVGNFTMVRKDFKIQAKQKVGIVVYNRYGVRASDKAVMKSDYEGDTDLTDDKLASIFGPQNSVVITVGEISYVGKHHLEYGLNSFRGCSGAVVFLLDVEDQPDNVGHDDRGKAIAVHAGFSPDLGTNIAFPFSFLDLKEGSTPP